MDLISRNISRTSWQLLRINKLSICKFVRAWNNSFIPLSWIFFCAGFAAIDNEAYKIYLPLFVYI